MEPFEVNGNWSYKDVPISKFKVLTEPNLVTGEIKQITEIAGRIQEEIINTKSEQIRNALIDIGWLPPEITDHLEFELLGLLGHWAKRRIPIKTRWCKGYMKAHSACTKDLERLLRKNGVDITTHSE